MADEINDAKLLNLANERMEKIDISQAIPTEDVYKKLGITEKDLQNLDGSSRFREYERDFLKRKIEILSDRVKDMDREDYDER